MSLDRTPFVGLAMSGGGARAMAFHLGCLRALHDRGILDRIKVLSTVSGGSVVGAAWAYNDGTFEEFDARMAAVLRRGLQWEITREVFCSWQGPRILATLLISGTASLFIAAVLFVLG